MSRFVPRVVLVVLPVAWLLLLVTLPVMTNRDVTVDVSCASGADVVAVWVESETGGSQFAVHDPGDRGPARRFVYEQPFTGTYQVRAGCGGTVDQWGVTALSTYDDREYRRLVCDDVAIATIADAPCHDQLP